MKVPDARGWLPKLGRLSRAIAFAALPALACLTPQSGHSQPIIDYGGHTPCSIWLSNTSATRQGLAWIYGAWSGLNIAGGLKSDVYDVGHTMKAEEIGNLVERICRQNMEKIMNLAVLDAYVATRAAKR